MARYTYSPGYIDSPAVQERDLNGDSDFGDTNEVIYYHSNTLHSIYALTDGSENVVERYRYSAYGQATVLDADWSVDADAASDVSNPYAFTGRRLDAESALMQYRNRYYDPGQGRFVSRDPAGYADWLNLYLYSMANPANLADALGLGVKPIDYKIFFRASIPKIKCVNTPAGPVCFLTGEVTEVKLVTAHWRGAFVWDCTKGNEDAWVDDSPGWDGFYGISGSLEGLEVGFGWIAKPSNRSSFESCKEKGKEDCIQYVVRLAVYFKKVYAFVPRIVDKVTFTKRCPCHPPSE